MELIEALLQLLKLQKDRQIVIKRCDKGAGIIILNFKDYTLKDGSTLGGRQTMGGTPGRESHMPYQIPNIAGYPSF